MQYSFYVSVYLQIEPQGHFVENLDIESLKLVHLMIYLYMINYWYTDKHCYARIFIK